MLRYSLGSLFLVLLYLSVGCAALVNANGIWPQVAVTLTLAILVLFSLGAIFWTDRKRVFAIGFTATGWLYFLLVFSDVTHVRPYLLTESAINQLFVTMHSRQTGPYPYYATRGYTTTAAYAAPIAPPAAALPTVDGNTWVYSAPVVQPNAPATLPAYSPIAIRQSIVDPQSFTNIGHSLWAIIVAFVGGVTAQLLAKGRKLKDVVEGRD